MQALLNAGSPDGEGKPTTLVTLGMMPSGRHYDLGTVIEIVANAIEIIERGMAEQPIMKETLAISTPASGMDRHRDGVASLPDVLAQSGTVTAVLVPLKTIARWRARHGSQFQFEIERVRRWSSVNGASLKTGWRPSSGAPKRRWAKRLICW